jgi:threonyl-tRNA synthetase
MEKGLISVIKIKEFIDVSEEESPKNFSIEEMKYFDVVDCIEIRKEKERSVCRVVGAFAKDKQELKMLKKRYSSYRGNSWYDLGKELDLFDHIEDEIFWRPRGHTAKERILSDWSAALGKEGFYILYGSHTTVGTEYKKMAFLQESEEAIEDFLNRDYHSKKLVDDNLIFYLAEELDKVSRSCLHLLLKIPTMAGLDCEAVLFTTKKMDRETKALRKALEGLSVAFVEEVSSQCGVQLRIADALGRRWVSASCFFEKQGVIQLKLLHSLERLVYLMLESPGGIAKRYLPEEVRLYVLSEDDGFFSNVEQGLSLARVRFGVDSSDDVLAKKLKKGWKERVPYAMILGSKEKEAGSVTILCAESRQSFSVEIDKIGQWFINKRESLED